jgi:hypothetical protein
MELMLKTEEIAAEILRDVGFRNLRKVRPTKQGEPDFRALLDNEYVRIEIKPEDCLFHLSVLRMSTKFVIRLVAH